MWCALGERKLNRLREQLKNIVPQPIVMAHVRGNLGHWIVLMLPDGSCWAHQPKTGETRPSVLTWAGGDGRPERLKRMRVDPSGRLPS